MASIARVLRVRMNSRRQARNCRFGSLQRAVIGSVNTSIRRNGHRDSEVTDFAEIEHFSVAFARELRSVDLVEIVLEKHAPTVLGQLDAE
jgi:hypothetical protein